MTDPLAFQLAHYRAGRHIRVVNFHNTPAARAADYERQLAPYAAAFAPVTVADLDRLFETGEWGLDRPGVIPVLYEGYRNNVEVALPLIERLGLVAWLFIPTAWLDVEPDRQATFADAHDIGLPGDADRADRLAMRWSDVRVAADRHVICAHTATHAAADSIRDEASVEREIREPKRKLEAASGRPVEVFAWLFGAPDGGNAVADAALRSAGYRYLFSNTAVERITLR